MFAIIPMIRMLAIRQMVFNQELHLKIYRKIGVVQFVVYQKATLTENNKYEVLNLLQRNFLYIRVVISFCYFKSN